MYLSHLIYISVPDGCEIKRER